MVVMLVRTVLILGYSWTASNAILTIVTYSQKPVNVQAASNESASVCANRHKLRDAKHNLADIHICLHQAMRLGRLT